MGHKVTSQQLEIWRCKGSALNPQLETQRSTCLATSSANIEYRSTDVAKTYAPMERLSDSLAHDADLVSDSSTRDADSTSDCSDGDCLPLDALLWCHGYADPVPLSEARVGMNVLTVDPG